MSLDGVNERAQEKLNQLRTKFKLDQILTGLPTEKKEEIKRETRMFETTEDILKRAEAAIVPEEIKKETETKVSYVEDAFDFIDSLNLPPELSLVIGLIIAANKNENWGELQKARDVIKNFQYMKGYSR